MIRNIILKTFFVSALLLAFFMQGFSQRALIQLRKAPVGAASSSTIKPRVKVSEVAQPAETKTQEPEEQPAQAGTAKPIQRLQIYGGPKDLNRTGKRLPLRRVPVSNGVPNIKEEESH